MLVRTISDCHFCQSKTIEHQHFIWVTLIIMVIYINEPHIVETILAPTQKHAFLSNLLLAFANIDQ